MSGFDPNDDPETQEQADAYIDWCAENYARVSANGDRTYRTALRCASWLLVISTAQLHLDEDVETDREALLTQLGMYHLLGRAIERQRQHCPIARLVTLRSSLDCWESTGEWGDHLLSAAKCATAALTAIEAHPLMELWDLSCPDVWALLDCGAGYLAEINLTDLDELTYEDFSVRPDEMAIAKFTWQRANNITRHFGLPPLSEN